MIRYNKPKKLENKQKKENKNSRLQILATIIFLFAGVLIYRLISLQVINYDFYVALASDQHLVENELMPKRGRIFIQDSNENKEKKFYPVATNKDFAFIYAVPKKIKEPQRVAEELYKIFDEKGVNKEVEKVLREDPFFALLFPDKKIGNNIASTTIVNPSAEELKDLKELVEIKRIAETKLRKDQKIKEYIVRLDKPGDPYEPIKRKVDDEILKQVLAIDPIGLSFFNEKHRYYPEKEMGSQILGFVGFQDDKEEGRYGLEGFFNEELTGQAGLIKAERAASGDLIIINDRELDLAKDGSDIFLTIDRSIQYMACKRLGEEAMKYGADGGSIIVMEPNTAAIIAMCSWPDYDPNNYSEVESINVYNNPAIFDSYEPGSIFKAITLAAGINEGKISPQTTYQDKGFRMIQGWDKPIKNSDYETHGGHGVVDMNTVLELSLNTGTIFAMEQMGSAKFAEYVKAFGFGEKTGIELETEGVSNISSLQKENIRPIEAATASFGQGITATPLQMITAYSAIINEGILMKPYIVSEIISPGGVRSVTQAQQIRRVITEKTALTVSGMLVNVVDRGHSLKAQVNGYYVGGKTGTAQVAGKGGYTNKTIHTFIGFAPAEEPKFVLLVKFDNPKSVKFADSSSVPLFQELAAYILNYYQVEKER